MRKLISLLLLFAVFNINGQQLHQGVYFELDQSYTGTGSHIFEASDFVDMNPGFEYEAENTDFFNAHINPYLILPPERGKLGGADHGVVGTIPGALTVSSTGAAIYSIPIELPPGIAGMVPEIGLVYNSQGDDGIMGKGWALGGISAITRTCNSYYFNGFLKEVNFTDDQLVLDGQKMILIDQHNEEYRLEVDNLTRILKKYFVNSNGTSIPYFETYTKSGLVKTYGGTENSQLTHESHDNPALRYHLTEIRDKFGNYILYNYEKDLVNGTVYLSSIEYTGHSDEGLRDQILPEYKIEFNYAPLEDQFIKTIHLSNGVQGTPVKFRIDKRLETITIHHNTQELRKYTLGYVQHGLLNSYYLNDILLEANGSHFNKTRFDWIYNESSVNKEVTLMSSWADNPNELNVSKPVVGDFNNDGFDDVVSLERVPFSGTSEIILKINNGSNNFSDEASYIVTGAIQLKGAMAADFNGDGKVELIYKTANNKPNLIEFIYNNITGEYEIVHIGNIINETTNDLFYGDFDGDGLGDCITYELGILKWYQGSTQAYLTYSDIQTEIAGRDCDIYTGDFDGEGKSELLVVDTNHEIIKIVELNAQNNEFTAYEPDLNFSSFSNDDVYYVFNDFNGDGKTDVIVANPEEDNLSFYFSYGYGFEFQQTMDLDVEKVLSSDVNGDGMQDIIRINETTVHYNLLNKDGLTISHNYSFEIFGDGNPPPVYGIGVTGFGNFTGTGKNDFICYAYESGAYDDFTGSLTVYYKGDISVSKISGITNGFGRNTFLSYDHLPKTDHYTPGDGNTSYPLITTNPPINVVTQVQHDNGYGGSLLPSLYYYNSALFHLTGKGFLGFHEFGNKDFRNNSYIKHEFDFYGREDDRYYYPYKAVTELYTLLNEDIDKLVSQTTKTMGHVNTVASREDRIYFPYTVESITKQFDSNEDNSLLRVNKTKNENYDIYGNPGKVTLLKGPVEAANDESYPFKSESVFLYWNDHDKWALGNMYDLTVTKKAPDVPTITRHSKFKFYQDSRESTYGSLKSEIYLPDLDSSTRIEYTYDNFGNITTTNIGLYNSPDPNRERQSEVIYSEDYNHRFPTESIDPLLHTSAVEYDPDWGLPVKTTDPNGLEANNSYDDFGRLYKTVAPDGNTEYAVLRWVVVGDEETPPNALYYSWEIQSGSSPTKTYYNIQNRELRTVTTGFDGNKIFVDYTYDPDYGRLNSITKPYFKGEQSYQTDIFYDNLNRPVKKVLPGNRILEKSFDGLDITITNPNGQENTQVFNVNDEQVSLIDNDGNEVKYQYDADGKIIGAWIEGHNNTKIIHEYDDFGNLIKVTDPALGVFEFEYNAFGELTKTKHNGVVESKEIVYDKLGRMLSMDEPGVGTTAWVYDNELIGLPDEVSFVSSMNNDENSNSFDYDEYGRVLKQSEYVRHNEIEKTFITKNTYDEYGRPGKLVYPSDFSVIYTYNSFGYHNRVIRGDDHATIWELKEMNAQQQINKIELGNNLETVYDYYRETGFLKTINTFDDVRDIQDFTYTWDDIGNLTRREKDINGSILSEDFQYDELNQLITVNLNNGQALLEMDYDALGRILKKKSIDPLFHVADNYSYDDNGTNPYKLLSIDNKPLRYQDENQDISYTPFDKITNIKQWVDDPEDPKYEVDIFYGAGHTRKVQKINNYVNNSEQTKIYVGGSYEEITNDGQTQKVHYISTVDGLFAIFTEAESSSENQFSYVHKDHLGSVQSLTDEEGNLIEEYSYDAWGLRRDPITWLPYTSPVTTITDHGFTGHEHLDLFAMINMNGRVYDPVIGYFSSPDPLLRIPANTLGFNLYSYCNNNPLSYIDPSGFLESEVADIGGGPLVDFIIYLANHGYIDAGTSFVMGVYAGALELAFANGATDQEAANFANERASAVIADSEYDLTVEDGIKNVQDGIKRMLHDNNQIANLNSSIRDAGNGLKAIDGVFAGLHSAHSKLTANGQTEFDFSSYASEIALNSSQSEAMETITVEMTMGNASSDKDWNSEARIALFFFGLVNKGAHSATKAFQSSNIGIMRSAINNDLPTGSIKDIMRSTSWFGNGLKWAGIAGNSADLILTGVNIYKEGWTPQNITDLFFNGVAFIPVWGWMVSGVYSIGKFNVEFSNQLINESPSEYLRWNTISNTCYCFVEGTQVLMRDFSLCNIENIEIGDTVLTYNLITRELETNPVLKINIVVHDKLVRIVFSDGQEITSTDDHPYYVKDKGWCSFNPDKTYSNYGIETGQLEISDLCLKFKNNKIKRVRVEQIVPFEKSIRTYNLTKIANSNNYFANNVLVNNESIIPEKQIE